MYKSNADRTSPLLLCVSERLEWLEGGGDDVCMPGGAVTVPNSTERRKRDPTSRQAAEATPSDYNQGQIYVMSAPHVWLRDVPGGYVPAFDRTNPNPCLTLVSSRNLGLGKGDPRDWQCRRPKVLFEVLVGFRT